MASGDIQKEAKKRKIICAKPLDRVAAGDEKTTTRGCAVGEIVILYFANLIKLKKCEIKFLELFGNCVNDIKNHRTGMCGGWRQDNYYWLLLSYGIYYM